MTIQELADLIGVSSAGTNGRIDGVVEQVGSLDCASSLSALRKQVAALAADVADFKRRAFQPARPLP